jgi:hypothetical protein
MADSRHERSKFSISDQVLEDLRRLAPDPQFTVPDLEGTVEGWRAWGVPITVGEGVPRLYSVTHSNYYWAPRKRAQAQCLRGSRPKGLTTCKGVECPNEQCTCGFYSAKTFEHLQSMAYHRYHDVFHVVGRVANWGKVIEGSQGWRAQYAYPVELFVPFEAWRLAKPLGSLYGVPVSLKDILTEDQSTTTQEAR